MFLMWKLQDLIMWSICLANDNALSKLHPETVREKICLCLASAKATTVSYCDQETFRSKYDELRFFRIKFEHIASHP